MELIIEEISRGNKLISRHKFSNTSEINIGRGYTNDIILSDPHICPEHLRVSMKEGRIVVNNLSSVNGSLLDHKQQLNADHEVNSGDVISIGKSQIRLVLPNHPVDSSIKFSPFESIIDFIRRPSILIIQMLLFTSFSAFAFYLNAGTEVVVSKLLMSAVGMTLLFALFPCIFTLISHFTKHEARLWTHLGLSFFLFNIFWLVDFIETLLQFNLSSHWNGFGLSLLVTALLVFGLFWINLFIGFHHSAQRRMTLAISFTAIILATGLLLQTSSTPDFNYRPQYDSTLMSPTFQFAPSTEVDTFIKDARALFQSVDDAAKENNS